MSFGKNKGMVRGGTSRFMGVTANDPVLSFGESIGDGYINKKKKKSVLTWKLGEKCRVAISRTGYWKIRPKKCQFRDEGQFLCLGRSWQQPVMETYREDEQAVTLLRRRRWQRKCAVNRSKGSQVTFVLSFSNVNQVNNFWIKMQRMCFALMVFLHCIIL